jgi:sulfoxide reductase heme-binding subunit YedZ
MVRRLGGRRWSRLHQGVYVIAILATIHYFMQRKLEVYEPTVMAGLLLWLLSYRLVLRLWARRRLPVWAVFLLGTCAGLATAGGEALYFRLAMGVDPMLILSADLSLAVGLRPGWLVFLVGLAVTALAAARDLAKRQPARLRPA